MNRTERRIEIDRYVATVSCFGASLADASTIVLVSHALTGTHRVDSWWPDILGDNALFDPAGTCTICVEIEAEDGIPALSIASLVSLQRRALSSMGVRRIDCVIGASMGGMQALQWALDAPEVVERAIVIASADYQHADAIAWNAIAREVIALDPPRGLGIARKIATLTYKSAELLEERHGRAADRNAQYRYDVEGFLAVAAQRLVARMSPAAYLARLDAMDTFDLRERIEDARSVQLHFIGISSDRLVPPAIVEGSARRARAAGWQVTYDELESAHGHDAFLAEPGALRAVLAPYFTTLALRTYAPIY